MCLGLYDGSYGNCSLATYSFSLHLITVFYVSSLFFFQEQIGFNIDIIDIGGGFSAETEQDEGTDPFIKVCSLLYPLPLK